MHSFYISLLFGIVFGYLLMSWHDDGLDWVSKVMLHPQGLRSVILILIHITI